MNQTGNQFGLSFGDTPKRSRRRPAIVAALALAALALAPAGALASGATSVAIGGGTTDFMTAPVPGNFTAVTLDGTLQSTTAAIPTWSVNDASGSLSGWNVKMSATQFSTGSGDTLAVGSMTYNPSSAVVALSGQSTALAPAALPLGAAIDGSVARQIVLAAAGTGAAKWQFTQGAGALTLSIPPTVKAGTYSSTVTTTLTQGLL